MGYGRNEAIEGQRKSKGKAREEDKKKAGREEEEGGNSNCKNYLTI